MVAYDHFIVSRVGNDLGSLCRIVSSESSGTVEPILTMVAVYSRTEMDGHRLKIV